MPSHGQHRCKDGEWKKGFAKHCAICHPPKKTNLAIKVKW
jgi:hypothetical protein